MIKKILFTSIIILFSLNCFSQKKNELRVYYGISDSELLRNDELTGAGSTDLKSFSEFGLKYLRNINNKLALETGFNYSNATIIIKPPFMGEQVASRKENFELISIPLYANYTLWNYFFINGGPMIDFQISDNSTDSQDGIGYSLGVGGKYSVKNFNFYLNPNFKRHALIPFDKENNHQKLTEFGIQVGIGYKF